MGKSRSNIMLRHETEVEVNFTNRMHVRLKPPIGLDRPHLFSTTSYHNVKSVTSFIHILQQLAQMTRGWFESTNMTRAETFAGDRSGKPNRSRSTAGITSAAFAAGLFFTRVDTDSPPFPIGHAMYWNGCDIMQGTRARWAFYLRERVCDYLLFSYKSRWLRQVPT